MLSDQRARAQIDLATCTGLLRMKTRYPRRGIVSINVTAKLAL